MESERKGYSVGWVIVAALLIGLGVLAFYSTLNVNPISDSEYLQLLNENNLPLGAVSESSYSVSYYGGLGFIAAGFACLGLAVYMRLKF